MADTIVTPAEALPVLFRLERELQAFSGDLEQQQAAAFELWQAYGGTPMSLATAADLHQQNIGRLTALRWKLQNLRYQLSKVLP